MFKKKVELLAPAGNPEGFYGALHAGADAVYLGGSMFGARAYADNFSEEELVECIRYAHILGRRVYLTVNTLVREEEFSRLYGYILPYYQAGLDGVIIQDLGVLLFIRQHFPGMELHASTQMTLTGSCGARQLKDLGVCRIVPARELSLEEIRSMKKDTGLEMETFIHGAMCYCYSGQCLFSSILGGRSGNRGRCAQPCRLPYSIAAEGASIKECYPLSLKDMCTIDHIPELIEAGIDSFKIEGRMKKPEYAAGVTAIYRKYIDAWYAHPEKKQRIAEQDLKTLSCLYIRSERQNGYYFKHNGADMVTLSSPAYSGSDETLLSQIRSRYLEQKPRIKVDFYARFLLGEPAQLTLIAKDCSATITGAPVSPAQKQPVSEENIARQLQKLGDTLFEPGEAIITMDQNIFYSLKAVNDLRRQAVSQLEEALIRSHGLIVKRQEFLFDGTTEGTAAPLVSETARQNLTQDTGLTVSVRTASQLKALCRLVRDEGLKAKRICVDADALINDPAGQLAEILHSLHTGPSFFLAMPYIIRQRDREYLKKLMRLLSQKEWDGCMVRSLEGYAYLKEEGYQGKLSSDAGFYIWNRETLRFWNDRLDYFCLPLELNAREQKALCTAKQQMTSSPVTAAGAQPEKIIYGRIPMMITANCVAKTAGQCYGSRTGSSRTPAKYAALGDRYRKQFPVEVNCTHCMNIIYNSVPLSLHSDCMKWKSLADLRLDFTVEEEEQTCQVIRYFRQVLEDGLQASPPYEEFTKGHEKRGVE